MRTIIIDAAGDSSWIGGLYYIKNILFSIISNDSIIKNNKFIIISNKENQAIFEEFRTKCEIVLLNSKATKIRKAQLLGIALKNKAKAIYPYWQKPFYSYFGITEIFWFADFQECHFPQFYSSKQLNDRKKLILSVVKKNKPIVLSSRDTWKDLEGNYGVDHNAYLMPFVSYIEPEVKKISKEIIENTKEKFDITDRYVCVSNQFWQHKNHIVVFKALAEFYKNNPSDSTQFVFTGKMEDYRNPEYIDEIINIIKECNLNKHIKILGFVDRIEQLALMRGADFIIQPSLFEGWGTVVEDAKVLDKTILLSDIPVHREQMNEKCTLFDPYDPAKLAHLIEQEIKKPHKDDIEIGLANMYKQAQEYSKEFEKLLNTLEGN